MSSYEIIPTSSEFRDRTVTKYHPSMAATAKAMAKCGATDFEIYTELGCTQGTFNRWLWQHQDFKAGLKLGKKEADDRVERMLYARAVGYSYDSEKLITVSQGEGCPSEVQRHHVVEHVPPDPNAAMYWLNNRRSSQWRNTVQAQVAGTLKFEAIQRDSKDMAV